MRGIVVAAVAAVGVAACASAALAEGLGERECTALWRRANPGKAESITKRQAEPYITDIASASSNGGLTISAKEWQAACKNGLVKQPTTVAGSADAPRPSKSKSTTKHKSSE